MLNEQFFASIRSSIYTRRLPQSAVDSFNAVVAAFDKFDGPTCTDDLAVILATVVIETGIATNLAVEETGKGRGHDYGTPAGPYGKVYYGRGPCQVTWLKNYQTAKTRTKIDFVQFPELMCDPHYGVVYMIDAMFGGTFTGLGLRNFVKPGVTTTYANFYSSRKIINGLDRAGEHCRYCLQFASALRVGYEKPNVRTPLTPASNSLPQAQPRRGLVSEIASWFWKG